MRVDLLDPPAYSLPYDHALAAALAALGAEVRLLTSRFAYGEAPVPRGYGREEVFYRHALGPAGSRLRALSKRAEHPLDTLRYRRAAPAQTDICHYQWLMLPRLDLRLAPRRPVVLTLHDPLPRLGRSRLAAAAFDRVAAVVVLSQAAREQVVAEHGLEPERVHVIHHGVLGPREGFPPLGGGNPSLGDARLPPELEDNGEPVVLSYGLIRPYKGTSTLLEAWRGISGAQLWVVGRAMMDSSALFAAAPAGARLIPRFVSAAEQAALFERADLVVLPYERSERFGFSGVLATALGYGKAIVISDLPSMRDVGELGAARLVAPSDAAALHAALVELLGDCDARAALAAAAASAAAGPYSWEAAGRATLALYERILAP